MKTKKRGKVRLLPNVYRNSTVTVLREALSAAKNNAFQWVVVLGYRADGVQVDYYVSRGRDRDQLLGAMERAKYDLLTEG